VPALRFFEAHAPKRWLYRWCFVLVAVGTVALLSLRLVTAPSAPGASETLTFEAFAVKPAGERERLAGGAHTYDVATELIVQEAQTQDETHWIKSILLEGDFAISADVYRESKVTGFGLFVQRPDNARGFSWEWFDLERDNIFLKRQGSGRVAVTLSRASGCEELQTIEFLDDIVLRFLDDMRKPPGTHTHELVVLTGSVLRLASQNEPHEADAASRLTSGCS